MISLLRAPKKILPPFTCTLARRHLHLRRHISHFPLRVMIAIGHQHFECLATPSPSHLQDPTIPAFLLFLCNSMISSRAMFDIVIINLELYPQVPEPEKKAPPERKPVSAVEESPPPKGTGTLGKSLFEKSFVMSDVFCLFHVMIVLCSVTHICVSLGYI